MKIGVSSPHKDLLVGFLLSTFITFSVTYMCILTICVIIHIYSDCESKNNSCISFLFLYKHLVSLFPLERILLCCSLGNKTWIYALRNPKKSLVANEMVN